MYLFEYLQKYLQPETPYKIKQCHLRDLEFYLDYTKQQEQQEADGAIFDRFTLANLREQVAAHHGMNRTQSYKAIYRMEEKITYLGKRITFAEYVVYIQKNQKPSPPPDAYPLQKHHHHDLRAWEAVKKHFGEYEWMKKAEAEIQEGISWSTLERLARSAEWETPLWRETVKEHSWRKVMNEIFIV